MGDLCRHGRTYGLTVRSLLRLQIDPDTCGLDCITNLISLQRGTNEDHRSGLRCVVRRNKTQISLTYLKKETKNGNHGKLGLQLNMVAGILYRTKKVAFVGTYRNDIIFGHSVCLIDFSRLNSSNIFI